MTFGILMLTKLPFYCCISRTYIGLKIWAENLIHDFLKYLLLQRSVVMMICRHKKDFWLDASNSLWIHGSKSGLDFTYVTHVACHVLVNIKTKKNQKRRNYRRTKCLLESIFYKKRHKKIENVNCNFLPLFFMNKRIISIRHI